VPGPWQADQNRVPRPVTSPETWILGPSTFSAQLAAQLGRPYAFALQFGNADVVTALRLYRGNFQPSEVLSEPHSLVSVGVLAHGDAGEARRQSRTAAMAMLRMLQRQSYLLLPPRRSRRFPRRHSRSSRSSTATPSGSSTARGPRSPPSSSTSTSSRTWTR